MTFFHYFNLSWVESQLLGQIMQVRDGWQATNSSVGPTSSLLVLCFLFSSSSSSSILVALMVLSPPLLVASISFLCRRQCCHLLMFIISIIIFLSSFLLRQNLSMSPFVSTAAFRLPPIFLTRSQIHPINLLENYRYLSCNTTTTKSGNSSFSYLFQGGYSSIGSLSISLIFYFLESICACMLFEAGGDVG